MSRARPSHRSNSERSKRRRAGVVLLASVIAVIGAYLLGGQGARHAGSTGDTLLLISDIAWAYANFNQR